MNELYKHFELIYLHEHKYKCIRTYMDIERYYIHSNETELRKFHGLFNYHVSKKIFQYKETRTPMSIISKLKMKIRNEESFRTNLFFLAMTIVTSSIIIYDIHEFIKLFKVL